MTKIIDVVDELNPGHVSNEEFFQTADKFIYVPTRKNGKKRPIEYWSTECPDDIDPRSVDNPMAYTYKETLEHGYGGPYAIIGVREEGHKWVCWDVDIKSDGHEKVIEHPDEVKFDASLTTVVKTKNGMHLHQIYDGDAAEFIQERETCMPPGSDVSSDCLDLGIAVSPFHGHEDYELKNAGDVAYTVPDNPKVWMSYEGEAVTQPATTSNKEFSISNEAPDGLTPCLEFTLTERTRHPDNLKYYDRRYHADMDSAYLMIANGYSDEEAVSLFEQRPPTDGFDRDETKKQVQSIRSSIEDGGQKPPSLKLAKLGFPVEECDCAAHEHWGKTSKPELKPILPRLRNADKNERRGIIALHQARQETKEVFSTAFEEDMLIESYPSMGKSTFAALGAQEEQRLVITSNKTEARERMIQVCEQHAISYWEIVPFGDGWHANESIYADEIMALYKQGIAPKYLIQAYGEPPATANTPYIDQFENGVEEYQLLLGSFGHHNVDLFTKDRTVIFDDVDIGVSEPLENLFTLDQARAEFNELLQEVDDLPNSYSDLTYDHDAIIQRLSPGVKGHDEIEPESVWEALELVTTEGDNIPIGLVNIAKKRENVTGDTLTKLKVARGVEPNNIAGRHISSGYTWYQCPDMDGPVITTSATPQKHPANEWFNLVRGSSPKHQRIGGDWGLITQGKGIETIQISENRNSRSGGNGSKKTYDKLEAIERTEGEVHVIDSLKMKQSDDAMHFGRMKSNNRFGDKKVGFLAGSSYYPDDSYTVPLAELCGADPTIDHEGSASADDPVTQEILDTMTRGNTLQAVCRFGREPEVNARIYVDTNQIPDCLNPVNMTDEINFFAPSVIDVADCISENPDIKQKGIADEVGLSRQRVGQIIELLEEKGKITVDRGYENDFSENRSIKISIVEFSESPRKKSVTETNGPIQQDLHVKLSESTGKVIPGAKIRDRPETKQTELD